MSTALAAFTAPALLLAPDAEKGAFDSVLVRPHIPYATNGNTIELTPLHIEDSLGKCPK